MSQIELVELDRFERLKNSESCFRVGLDLPGMGDVTVIIYDGGDIEIFDAALGRGGELINFNEEAEVIEVARRAIIFFELTGSTEGFVA